MIKKMPNNPWLTAARHITSVNTGQFVKKWNWKEAYYNELTGKFYIPKGNLLTTTYRKEA